MAQQKKRSSSRSTSKRRYSKGASEEVRTEMRHLKEGKHGRRLKSRKQAIAIGLAKARRKGERVPPPKKRRSRSTAKSRAAK
jgi:hypothetical protein